MERSKKALVFLLAVMLAAPMLAPVALANSAEPPNLTIIVPFPPEDLMLFIQFEDGSIIDPIELYRNQKAWEAYYRFYYSSVSSTENLPPDKAVLIIQSGETRFECSLPALGYYSNLLTLDITNERLLQGMTTTRILLLTFMRVTLTLLIEGLIFFAFGYRSKRSWIVFAVLNLITQGALNYLLSSAGPDSYWIIGYVFYEIIIFAVEMTAFGLLIAEHRKRKAVAYAFTANFASLFLGGFALALLPV